jgi:lactoylglutathione lyase
LESIYHIQDLSEGIVEWPKSKSLYVEDPNGYEVELTNTWGGDLA